LPTSVTSKAIGPAAIFVPGFSATFSCFAISFLPPHQRLIVPEALMDAAHLAGTTALVMPTKHTLLSSLTFEYNGSNGFLGRSL
jgi:hypothetical protein